MRAILCLALPLALVGCASLQGDGYYACARSGRCPSSAPVCGSDGLCHALGVDAGASDAGASGDAGADASLPALTYPACNGGVADVCGADTCYYDPVLGSTNHGYCTRSCTSDAECPMFDGAASMCLHGQCARGCTGTADCPDGLACAAGRWKDGAALRLCVSLVDAEANWYTTCELDGDCQRPLSCIHGTCVRACATSADCVEFLETCVTSAVGPRGCLYDCAMPSDCDTLTAQCTNTTCHPQASW